MPEPSRAPRVAVVIPAAGSGTRLAAPGSLAASKGLLTVGGVPLLLHTVRRFQEQPGVDVIAVVIRPEDQATLERAFAPRERWSKLLPWVAGGLERQQSVWQGLQALAGQPPQWVLVHDGARPLCSAALVERVLGALQLHAAVVPVLPVPDTLRRIQPAPADAPHPTPGGAGRVVDRSMFVACQTPQGFHWQTLLQAHQRAQEEGFLGTDDVQLVERLGTLVATVPGESRNIKVTFPADRDLAEWALERPDWGL